MDENTIYWSELAELDHFSQVKRFGFCTCEDKEDNDYPYSNCETAEGV